MSRDISKEFGLNYLTDKKNSIPEGLTPRDVFAAFALAGILAQPNGNPLGNPHDVGLRWCAATAFDLADAMLAQREQGSRS